MSQATDAERPEGWPAWRRVAVGCLAWALLLAAWLRVRQLDAGVSTSTLIWLAVWAGVVLLVHLAWIEHNRAIYRRRGPRRGRPSGDVAYVTDSIGRPVQMRCDADTAAEVVISIDAAGAKVYQPNPLP